MRAASRDGLDDLEQLVDSVAVTAGEPDEAARAVDDCALLGRPDDGDPAAAAKLEEAADGSGEQRLTHDFVGGSWSSWSPDGRRIAFSGSGGIYVINADGTGLKRLTKNEVWDQGPIWSPDGRKIAFYSERDGNGEIYVMNADGSDPRNVSHSGTRGSGLFSWSPR